MLQSLMSLEDDQIDLVLNTVSSWCQSHGVAIESDEGRRAINVAVNILCSTRVDDLPAELRAQLEQRHVPLDIGPKPAAGISNDNQ